MYLTGYNAFPGFAKRRTNVRPTVHRRKGKNSGSFDGGAIRRARYDDLIAFRIQIRPVGQGAGKIHPDVHAESASSGRREYAEKKK